MITEKNALKATLNLSVANSRTTLDLLKLRLLALSLAQQQTTPKENRLFRSFVRNPLD